MLTLNDGRSELWQWDTGRKLAVDADCSQVHFSNKVFGRSIDVDVVDGIAVIPDILLQTDKDLNAWAFVGTAENGYTKISKIFKVNKRNKPADYVFTPTEQTTLGEILDRIEDLENRPSGDVSEEDIQNAVNDYLDKNPISVAEKDPTVPAWAKKPNKPTYTAAEVGALPNTTAIPVVPSALPNPHKLTIKGAVQAEYDGSSAVSVTIPESGSGGGDYIPSPTTAKVGQTIVVKAVDENGKPTEWESADMVSGGGSAGLLFKEKLEITEPTAGLIISTINGNAFCYKRVVLFIKAVTASTTSDESNTWLNPIVNNVAFQGVQHAVQKGSGTKYSTFDFSAFADSDSTSKITCVSTASANSKNVDVFKKHGWIDTNKPGITAIKFAMGDSYTTFENGTTIYIFAEE